MQNKLNYDNLSPQFLAKVKEGNTFYKLSSPLLPKALPYFKKISMLNQIKGLIENGLLNDYNKKLKLDMLSTLSELINIEPNFQNVDYYDKKSITSVKNAIDKIPNIIELSFDYDLFLKEKEKENLLINSNILNMAYRKTSKYIFENENANIKKYSEILIKNISKTLLEYKRKCNNPIQAEFAVIDLKKLILDLESIMISIYIKSNNITLFEEDIHFAI